MIFRRGGRSGLWLPEGEALATPTRGLAISRPVLVGGWRPRAPGLNPNQGPATQLGITVHPAGATTGQVFATQPVVEVRNSLGERVDGATNQVTASVLSGPGSLSGTTQVNAVNGVATFTNLSILGQGDHVLRFTASGLTSADSNSFNVADSSSLVFASDWSTATGNNDNAVRDGGKWTSSQNIANPSADRVTVLAQSGLGLDFPAAMANVLAIRYENATDTFCGIFGSNLWTLPAIGSSLFTRCYFRHTISGSHSFEHHPSQACASAGGCCPDGWWKMDKGSTINFSVAVAEGTGSQHKWTTQISRGQTYRLEEEYARTGTNTFTMHLRLYNSSNVLIADDDDFDCTFHGPGQHLLSSNPSITVNNLTCYRNRILVNQGVGFNGSGSDDPNNNRIFYGGMAASHTAWCGAYSAGEGP